MSADAATPFELGVAAGTDRAGFAGDCPFDASRMEERREWMRGFGQARAALLPPGAVASQSSPMPPLHEG